jgi:hypothetical protein
MQLVNRAGRLLNDIQGLKVRSEIKSWPNFPFVFASILRNITWIWWLNVCRESWVSGRSRLWCYIW